MSKFECGKCGNIFEANTYDVISDECPACYAPAVVIMDQCKLRKEGDPVHQHKDGSWWWYDETWSDENGPYASEEECMKELQSYIDNALVPQDVNESSPGWSCEDAGLQKCIAAENSGYCWKCRNSSPF